MGGSVHTSTSPPLVGALHLLGWVPGCAGPLRREDAPSDWRSYLPGGGSAPAGKHVAPLARRTPAPPRCSRGWNRWSCRWRPSEPACEPASAHGLTYARWALYDGTSYGSPVRPQVVGEGSPPAGMHVCLRPQVSSGHLGALRRRRSSVLRTSSGGRPAKPVAIGAKTRRATRHILPGRGSPPAGKHVAPLARRTPAPPRWSCGWNRCWCRGTGGRAAGWSKGVMGQAEGTSKRSGVAAEAVTRLAHPLLRSIARASALSAPLRCNSSGPLA